MGEWSEGGGGLGKWPRSLYPDTNGKYVFCIAGVPGLILVTMTETGKYVFCIAGSLVLILVTLTQTGKYVFCIAGVPGLILVPVVF